MSISAFTARVLTPSVRNLGSGQKHAYLDGLFRHAKPSKTRVIDFGEKISNPEILNIVRDNAPAVPVELMTGTLKTVIAPKLNPSKFITEADAQVLDPSVSSYAGSATDPNANLADRLDDELVDLRNKIDTTVLVNSAVALSTGVLSLAYPDGGTVGVEYGYGSAGTAVDSIIRTTLAGNNVWGGSTANPAGDIDLMSKNIRKTSSYMGPLDVLMGDAAFEQFRLDSAITGNLDNRRIEGGNIKLNEMSEYKGTWNGYNIYVMSYAYKTKAGVWTDAWDPKKVVVVPRKSNDFSIEFGPVFGSLEPGSIPVWIQTDYFAHIVVETNPASVNLIVESHPIPLVKNPLGLRTQQVIA